MIILATVGWHVIMLNVRIHIDNNSCRNVQSGISLSLLIPQTVDNIGKESCVGERGSCQKFMGSIGDKSCIGLGSCSKTRCKISFVVVHLDFHVN